MSSLKQICLPDFDGRSPEDAEAGQTHLALLYQFAALFEDSDTLIAVFDPDDRLRMSNTAFRTAFFIGPAEHPTWEEFMRRNHSAGRGMKLPYDDVDTWISAVASRRGKEPSVNFEIGLLDGRWLAMHETAHATGWLLTVGCDVTHLHASERSLRVDRDDARRAVDIDDLTGVSSRRHIMSMLEMMRNGDVAMPLAGGFACLIDIDHFKRVNDTYGHQAGDEVLVAFAQNARRSIRLCDSFGRVGGEEFLTLIATDDTDVALEVMDRVFRTTRALRPLEDHPAFGITISAGLCRIAPEEDAAAIYSRCDKLLYQAKSDGRDRLLHRD